MAWTTITDSLIDFLSEWTTTVLTYIRDDLNYLRATRGEVLYQMPSGVFYNKPDTAGETIYYSMPTGSNDITYDIGNGGNQIMIDGLAIRIPAGCVTVRCRAQLRAEATDADLKIRFNIGTATADKGSIATSATWYDVDVDVTGLDGAEQALEIRAVNSSGAIKWVKITRLIILALA
jgi:hypothetical protein